MLTPGVRVSKSSNLRPRIGVVFTVCSLIVVLASVFTVSTTGVEVIVTRSSTPDTFIVTGKFSVWPTVSSIVSATAVANPVFDTEIEYLPGGIVNATKRPPSSVVRVLERLVSRFLISTLAPATAAPLASSTVPCIVPVVLWLWANAVKAEVNTISTLILIPLAILAKAGNVILYMGFSPVSGLGSVSFSARRKAILILNVGGELSSGGARTHVIEMTLRVSMI